MDIKTNLALSQKMLSDPENRKLKTPGVII
jgi:hypothetical protein